MHRLGVLGVVSIAALSGCIDWDGLSSAKDGGVPGPPAHCSDGVLDDDETDVDCGGACATCAPDKLCGKSADCETDVCQAGYCTLASGPPSWVRVADLPTGRVSLGVAEGADGLVYAIGGNGAAGDIAVVEAYSPADDAWVARMSLSMPRSGMGTAIGADGRVYVVGGEVTTPTAEAVSADVEAYDTAKDEWVTVAPMLTARAYLTAVTGPDHLVYAFDGAEPMPSTGSYPPVSERSGATATDPWSSSVARSMGTIFEASALGTDGRIYIFGGFGAAGSLVTSWAPGEAAWTQVADLTTPRSAHAGVTGPDGRIYAIGGNPSNSVEAYSPVGNRWTSCPLLVVPRAALGAAVGADGRIYAVGGSAQLGGVEVTNLVEAYGPIIRLSTATSTTGAMLSVTGSNFASQANVHIYLDDASGAPIATGATDTDGTLTSPIGLTAPAQPGSHVVIAVDDRSRYPVRASLQVN